MLKHSEIIGDYITQPVIEDYIKHGNQIDLILKFSSLECTFFTYAKFVNKPVVRQILTQRHDPRNFKNIHRAMNWAKNIGFKSVHMTVDLSCYAID
ncbi:MAG: hypothetical protein V4629_11670 [Pseudomonadota bacterium]